MPRKDDIENLIFKNRRRLQILKEKLASFGINTSPEILIEIQDIETEIEKLQTELERGISGPIPPDETGGCLRIYAVYGKTKFILILSLVVAIAAIFGTVYNFPFSTNHEATQTAIALVSINPTSTTLPPTHTPTPTNTLIPPTDTPVPPSDTPTPTPTSEIDEIFKPFENISRLLLKKDLATYVGTFDSETEEYLNIYSLEDWDTCQSGTPDFNSNVGEPIVAQIRGEWAVPDCSRNSFETRVTEDLIVLEDTQASEDLYRDLVAEARRAPFFKSGFEMETQYATFWVVRSDYEDGTTAIMVTRVDEAVIQISIESDEVIDERNLSILTLAAVVQLINYPLNRGVPILLDPSLFAENVGRSLAVYPIPQTRRVYEPQPTISEIIQMYGEPDRIEETQLHYASDELDDSIELDAKVYYYGTYGFGILIDQEIDQDTLDYIKEAYGPETYEPLINPKNGEVIWVVVEQSR